MGYWGWRPLILSMFISVLIVSCVVDRQTAPTTLPTDYPPITLTVRVPITQIPIDGLSIPPHTTFQPFEVIDPSSALLVDYTPHALTTPPLNWTIPECYEMQTGGIVCLGEVFNPLSEPVEHIALEMLLLDETSEQVAWRMVTLEQRVLPAGDSAPYRVLFTAQERAARYILINAVRGSFFDKRTARFAVLNIQNQHGFKQDDRYLVAATLHNPNAQPVESIRLVVTLYNVEGDVIGYRVVELPQTLEAGKSLPVMVSVIAQENTQPSRHKLYVEALKPAAR